MLGGEESKSGQLGQARPVDAIPPHQRRPQKSLLENWSPGRALGSQAEQSWCGGRLLQGGAFSPQRASLLPSSFLELFKSLARALRDRVTGLSPVHPLLTPPSPPSWALSPLTPPNSNTRQTEG